jgi:hypothetical protein
VEHGEQVEREWVQEAGKITESFRERRPLFSLNRVDRMHNGSMAFRQMFIGGRIRRNVQDKRSFESC